MESHKFKHVTEILLVILGFIFVSYIAQSHTDFFIKYVKNNFFSMIIYICMLIVSAVIAPIDIMVLMPIATQAWGWFLTALLSLFGWMLGTAVVFFISRKYGVPLVKKILPLKKIHEYQSYMPEKHLFVSIILLRIAIPFDIISYAISIFTRVKFGHFFFATLIGFAPLAFYLAYLGSLPIKFQIAGFILLLLSLFLTFLSIKHKVKRDKK